MIQATAASREIEKLYCDWHACIWQAAQGLAIASAYRGCSLQTCPTTDPAFIFEATASSLAVKHGQAQRQIQKYRFESRSSLSKQVKEGEAQVPDRASSGCKLEPQAELFEALQGRPQDAMPRNHLYTTDPKPDPTSMVETNDLNTFLQMVSVQLASSKLVPACNAQLLIKCCSWIGGIGRQRLFSTKGRDSRS